MALRRAALSAHSLEGLVSVGENADLQGVFRKLFGSWRLVDSRSGIFALPERLRPLPAIGACASPLQ